MKNDKGVYWSIALLIWSVDQILFCIFSENRNQLETHTDYGISRVEKVSPLGGTAVLSAAARILMLILNEILKT